MAQHVGGYENVFSEPVAGGEVCVARVAGKYHLEEARVAHVPLNELIDVANAERPVRHAHRQAVYGDLHHEGVRDSFEFNGVERKTRTGRELFYSLCIVSPVVSHELCPIERLGLRAEEVAYSAPDVIEVVESVTAGGTPRGLQLGEQSSRLGRQLARQPRGDLYITCETCIACDGSERLTRLGAVTD